MQNLIDQYCFRLKIPAQSVLKSSE